MSHLAYTTYRIDQIPSSTNEYTTGRAETWTLKPDRLFSDLEEAKDYVRGMNRAHSDLPLFLVDLKTEEDKSKMVDEFCFSDKYLHLARYFLGKPDKRKIISAIENQGIRVLKL